MSTGEIKPSGLHVPGFQHLGWLLPQHIDLVPELYFLFIALMMGQPVKLLPTDSKVKILLIASLNVSICTFAKFKSNCEISISFSCFLISILLLY